MTSLFNACTLHFSSACATERLTGNLPRDQKDSEFRTTFSFRQATRTTVFRKSPPLLSPHTAPKSILSQGVSVITCIRGPNLCFQTAGRYSSTPQDGNAVSGAPHQLTTFLTRPPRHPRNTTSYNIRSSRSNRQRKDPPFRVWVAGAAVGCLVTQLRAWLGKASFPSSLTRSSPRYPAEPSCTTRPDRLGRIGHLQ
ncbi:uncharacterized protein LY89DRAFT_129658 [Mollisia scopiformis]|uniref:Uncharacterized protein n=1 Tax=Mollisia scopiformis TaxID=149040 RepID=A0A194X4J2_MOLSC|nr:uncharacterized protein LY89DRAFT_129658 [Mollisia scopiformis]KUJ15098.1 hypothetical protein LY89DRAFT_129658 [Mollisia scopiformis]